VAQPHLPGGLSRAELDAAQRMLLDELIDRKGIEDYVLWFYAPMAAAFTRHPSMDAGLSPEPAAYDRVEGALAPC
jgi:UDP-galactopyranose mutase